MPREKINKKDAAKLSFKPPAIFSKKVEEVGGNFIFKNLGLIFLISCLGLFYISNVNTCELKKTKRKKLIQMLKELESESAGFYTELMLETNEEKLRERLNDNKLTPPTKPAKKIIIK